MSDYTTQIRFICESKSGMTESVGFNGIMEAIENSVDDIFSFDWPIFDEAYRVPLEIKILRHFYTREIGEETFGLWQLRLCDRLNVIMPYYNQLYKSELIKFNPMYDVDLTTEHSRANDGIVDKSEHTDFSRTDSSERVNKQIGSEDGISDTDSVGTFDSEISGRNTETTQNSNSANSGEESSVNSSNITNSSEDSTSNSKSWGSNVTSNSGENEGNRKNKNVNRFSDTPQGNVSIGNAPKGSTGGTDGNVDIDSVFGNGYLTNVTIVDDKTETKDKNKSESLSDETNEGLVNQKINRRDSNDGVVNQSVKRDESGNSSGTKNGTQNTERNDTKKDKVNTNTSSIFDREENENYNGNGTHTNDVTGKIKNISTEDFIQRVSGKRGGLTYSKMLDEFRKTFLNIDRMILNDLETLFIGLWE